MSALSCRDGDGDGVKLAGTQGVVFAPSLGAASSQIMLCHCVWGSKPPKGDFPLAQTTSTGNGC